MGTLTIFLSIYLLGGITFLPLFFALILLHAYITFPAVLDPSEKLSAATDSLLDTKDDGENIKSAAALASLGEKFQRAHERDVAAGYFAVCREYVPGGVNGKPPERTTPAGAVVETESPSVYQSMYRSIFDRKQGPTLDSSKSNNKPTKRARNVFYVVLRHGHLMLYDDIEQVEVRHVISLEHHRVSIYGGDEEIPEGELWIKRNAICLTRQSNTEDPVFISKPFYFFSENCSEKEDFYFALLQNQEVNPNDIESPPRPQLFANKDIITLVQQLHSSEEQLQTRWINALVGRLFLAMYKTPEIEDFIRQKITKKIARVKKPAFLSSIVLRKIDMGESAPFITNPRLRDLTIDGDCCAEADVKYRGNFRLEIATTARIDLGARFRVREVNLVLAAVVKKLEGHALVKFKPPPSNRIWISFETMPDMELSIEPIVSSRQITYNLILRAIESRIREVIAETLVLPHWDDMPFLDTSHQRYRGGIWTQSFDAAKPASQHAVIPDETLEDEAEVISNKTSFPPTSPRSKDERTMSMPTLSDSTPATAPSMKAAVTHLGSSDDTIPDHGGDSHSSIALKHSEPPKAIRSRSFASAADPLISMDHANVESQKAESKKTQHPDATSTMKAISHKSRPTSPIDVLAGSSPLVSQPLKEYNIKPQQEHDDQQLLISSPASISSPPTPTSAQSPKSTGQSRVEEKETSHSGVRSAATHEKKQSLGSISAATAAAAKSWGWNVLSRAKETRQQHHSAGAGTPENPIGRGRPLPPPGQPLPPPESPSTRVAQPHQTKRKPVPPSLLTSRHVSDASVRSEKAPPLPSRRRQTSTSDALSGQESLLVVTMPSESQPSSPQGSDPEPPVLPSTDKETTNHAGNDVPTNPKALGSHDDVASTESTGLSSSSSRDEGTQNTSPASTSVLESSNETQSS